MSRLTKRNATLKASCKENSTYDCLLEDDCITCDCNNKILEKLAHYEDLEEAGRLIELPCKVGDTVWVVGSRCLADEEPDDWCEYHDCDECSHNMKYTIFERRPTAYLAYSMTLGDSPNFIWGETVFATKAEAEAKLAELKGGSDE